MANRSSKVLLMGYGNPGRRDDGLGPALAEAVATLDLPNVTVDADYQLSVEDAEAASRHDVIIFADASVNAAEPFAFDPIEPAAGISFTTHSVSPAGVLGLARDLFGKGVEGYALGIRGYAFNEFGEGLSPQAGANLDAARRFIESVLRGGGFREAAAGRGAISRNEDILEGQTTCKTAST